MPKPNKMPEVTKQVSTGNAIIMGKDSGKPWMYTCPSIVQILKMLDGICPSEVCKDNGAVSQRMAIYMNSVLKGQTNEPDGNS